MSGKIPRIWVLLGPRRGDNNQVLALAEGLGLPFETRSLDYNWLRALNGRMLGKSLWSLKRHSRAQVKPPWPDLIIAIGRRSVPVARWIGKQCKGDCRLIRVGNPRMDPSNFDLVITTRQYPVPPGDNVVLLPLAMSRYRNIPERTDDERRWLDSLPRPHLLMALGGATKYWQLTPGSMAHSAQLLCARSKQSGGTLMVVDSPRTDPEVLASVRSALQGKSNCEMVDGSKIRFPVLLDDADEIFVTSDSISMMSEAVLTGRPVGLIPIEMSEKGERKLGRSGESQRRDLRQFWEHLLELGLVGPLQTPRSGRFKDPVETAVGRVKPLLGDFVE